MIERSWPPEWKEYLDQSNVIEIAPAEYSRVCPNCGGAGIVMLYKIKRGPLHSPPQKGKWLDLPGDRAGWYEGELLVEHCPVCRKGKKEEFFTHASRLSGDDLEISLQNFQTGPGYEGKGEAHAAMLNYLGMNKAPSGFTTLWGLYGRGKTHLLKGVVNGFRQIGILAQYYTLPDLLAEVREHFTNDKGALMPEGVIEAFRRTRVLCIDEITQVNLTPWAKETISRLLDWRYVRMGEILTVLATDSDPRNYPEDLQYLASRMAGGGIIQVGGVDVRAAGPLFPRKDLDLL